MWYTYLVRCSKNNSLYCGCTNDLDRRIRSHNDGSGAKYTRSFGPVTLVYYEEHPDRSTASKAEYAIKQLSRSDKELMITSDKNLLRSDS